VCYSPSKARNKQPNFLNLGHNVHYEGKRRLNRNTKLYVVLAILFAIITAIPVIFVSLPANQNPPKGPLEIGVGPTPDADLNKTEISIDIPDQTINVEVTFRFNQTEKYFIYVLLPYQALNAGAYAIHDYSMYSPLPLEGKPSVGNFSTNLIFNSTLGSSIVNASLDVNPSFPWLFGYYPPIQDELTLGVSIRVQENLIAIGDSFGASQSAIFTFFGNVNGIWSQEMSAFTYPASQMTLNAPFIVSLRLPPSSLYSDSQPGPIEYYVRQDQRWIMFSLDFLGGQYAQTLVCNFVNPTGQAYREIAIFVTGVFSAFFVTFLVEALKSFYAERGKTEQTLVESAVPSPSNEPTHHPDIKKLVKLVDDKFEKPWWLNPLIAILVILYVVIIGIIAYLLSILALAATNVQGESLFPSYVGLVAAFVSFNVLVFNFPRILPPEERFGILVNHNFGKLKKEKAVEEWEQPFLKALIMMKSRNPDFKLEDIQDKKLFRENPLLERLYR